ncbi:MAG: glycosyltransferase [Methanobacteriota archaeon]
METLKFLMTTTFYPPFHIGGDAVHVKYLSEELAKRGHEVHVMHSLDAHRLKRGKSEKAPVSEENGVHMHPLKSGSGLASTYKGYLFGRSGYFDGRYRALLKEIAPDVVHHHNISLLGASLLEKTGAYRQLYTAHDYWLICQKNNLMRGGGVCDGTGCIWCAVASGRPPQLWRGRLRLEDIDCAIAPSRYMAGKLSGLGLKIKVLPNFAPEPPIEIPDVPDNDFFLYLGVLEEHKGVRVLLEAFSKSDQSLILIGDGPLAGLVEETIGNLGLAPRVKYLGWMSDGRWPYLKKAKALLIPSIGPENHPVTALEAMSVGTPTVCSDMGGTKEIAGMLSEKLVIPADGLEAGLKDIRLPDLSREEILKTYLANFSPASYLTEYEKLARGTSEGTR